jgi:hypothetical protein
MTPDGLERRHTKRRQSFAEHGIVSARVRPGIDASVVDVSPAGALIETRHRLLPGSSVEISFAQDVRLPAVRVCRGTPRGRHGALPRRHPVRPMAALVV